MGCGNCGGTLSITPDTTLAEILDVYPELEMQLNELLPKFGQLKSEPVRARMAQSLTVERAAQASQVAVPETVIALRKAAGLPEQVEVSTADLTSAPSWVKAGEIMETLDARPMLAAGQHPRGMVLDAVTRLAAGKVFLLITPFVPGPLIDVARSQGAATWTRQGERGRFETYFGLEN